MAKNKKEVEETASAEEVKDNSKDEDKAKEPSAEELLQKQIDDLKEQHLRTAAEYANFRARSAKEKESTFSNAKASVIQEFLSVADNMDRAIAAEQGDFEALKKGVQMTYDGLKAVFEKLGVQSYGECGDKFDPNYHNAVMHVDDEEKGEGEIIAVFQKGYKLNDKVIRPAMVQVAN